MSYLKVIFIVLTLLVPGVAGAVLPEQVKIDFASSEGTVLMPIEEEYLVDLDASARLSEGDILSLVQEGDPIIHPQTGEILGTLDDVIGYLQVTQVKSGYSYVSFISGDRAPRKGDQVKRFEQVPSVFIDETGNSQLREELELGLPHLDWRDEVSSNKAELAFTLTQKALSVTNSNGTVLYQYPYRSGELAAPLGSTLQENTLIVGKPKEDKQLLQKTVDNLLDTVGLGGKDKRLENPAIIQSQQQNSDIWISQNLKGNPVGLVAGDLDADQTVEIAVAMEDRVRILAFDEGSLRSETDIPLPGGVKSLALDMADLDGNGFPELYLSAHSGTRLSSQVIEFRDGHYQRTITGIGWLLRIVRDQNQIPTLVGLKLINDEDPMSRQPFQISRQGDTLQKGPVFRIPDSSSFYGYTMFSNNNDGQLWAYLTSEDKLHVGTANGNSLWESAEYFGGTEVSFSGGENTRNEVAQQTFIQQRILPLPSGEVLVPQNIGSRLFELYRSFKNSRIVALQWDGITLQESWRTVSQSGYLADFDLADTDSDGDDELVTVVQFKDDNLLQEGRSALVIYELTQ